ncbi:hypothetical protein K435DRAFT_879312 [Dendrothele bispora CBS 962.96]|uniref:No apical meristem-associated C-terminal domain-containing protein n=1 Tax=Dendrothele bispora (strain CBS 962.96) TaxID=1314807 RepID=A0A4S8KLN1_DENBC|nr:hypothetical protein K435DRAFT_879312 [Dendrothele bispora CBS 962.96]
MTTPQKECPPSTQPELTTDQPRKRGRPKGSKNKPKESSAASEKPPNTTTKKPKKRGHDTSVPPVATIEDKNNSIEATEENEMSISVTWTEALHDTIIKEITDNPEIKQGLFPSPGTVVYDADGNIVKSNSKPKTEYHWKLARLVFEQDEKYEEVFEATTQTVAGQTNMIKKVNQAKAYLGQTREGLTSEEQIDMSLTNGFTTKWAEIQETVPYFFDMKNLIGERPNQTPVGLSNSVTTNDTSILLKGQSSDDDTTSDTSDEEGEEIEDDEINDDDESFGPKKGKSAPGKVRRKTKQTPADRFIEVEKESEATAHEKLLNQRLKVKRRNELEVAKVQAKAQVKIVKEKAKMEFAIKKRQMELDHE